MAKCPKCLQRKGKRHCPALGEGICPRCCATHRLGSIACPQECPHLEAEFYQRQRRLDRAGSLGRRFVESLQRLFSQETEREFAFNLQAEMYYFVQRNGVATDAAVGEALQFLAGLQSPLVVTQTPPNPLAEFLARVLANEKRYPSPNPADLQMRRNAIDKLLDHITTLVRHRHAGASTEASHCLTDEITAYFGCLDFTADLDYDPEADLPGEVRRSEGGLILPP